MVMAGEAVDEVLVRSSARVPTLGALLRGNPREPGTP